MNNSEDIRESGTYGNILHAGSQITVQADQQRQVSRTLADLQAKGHAVQADYVEDSETHKVVMRAFHYQTCLACRQTPTLPQR